MLLFLLAASLFAALSENTAAAAEGDISVDITSGGGVLCTGFYRRGELWVPAEALKQAGAAITDAPNGKGFLISVADPAALFGAEDLRALCGGAPLSLYFPAIKVDGVKYFDVTGTSAVTGLQAVDQGGTVSLNAITPAAPPASVLTSAYSVPITLAWDYVPAINPDIAGQAKIDGLDILSPTWFNLMDNSGGMANRGSSLYVASAHAKGYSVWALVSNSFNKSMTSAFFRNNHAMELFIARLLAYAKLYGLDGVNVDFEAMDVADRDLYTKFISMLGPVMSRNGIKTSVDFFVPANTNSSRSQDRGAIAKYVDYGILMAYDQHWRTCQTAGSVAAYNWVREKVQKTIAEGVPASKLMLGVPFYMRLWAETPTPSGKPKVSSKTLTMADSEALIASRGLNPVWLTNVRQHYYEYSANGKRYRVWAEDEMSLEQRLGLVKEFSLAGVGAWHKGHAKLSAWQTLKKVLNK